MPKFKNHSDNNIKDANLKFYSMVAVLMPGLRSQFERLQILSITLSTAVFYAEGREVQLIASQLSH